MWKAKEARDDKKPRTSGSSRNLTKNQSSRTLTMTLIIGLTALSIAGLTVLQCPMCSVMGFGDQVRVNVTGLTKKESERFLLLNRDQ
jgi:hypothetical protein